MSLYNTQPLVFTDRGDPANYDLTTADITADSSWNDWDLSSIIPVGTKAVSLFAQVQDGSTNLLLEFRENGNSNNRAISVVRTQVANMKNDGDCVVAVDSNRTIEYLASNTTWSSLTVGVKGWWT